MKTNLIGNLNLSLHLKTHNFSAKRARTKRFTEHAWYLSIISFANYQCPSSYYLYKERSLIPWVTLAYTLIFSSSFYLTTKAKEHVVLYWTCRTDTYKHVHKVSETLHICLLFDIQIMSCNCIYISYASDEDTRHMLQIQVRFLFDELLTSGQSYIVCEW